MSQDHFDDWSRDDDWGRQSAPAPQARPASPAAEPQRGRNFDQIAAQPAPALVQRQTPPAGGTAKLSDLIKASDILKNAEALDRLREVSAKHLNPERMLRLMAREFRLNDRLAQATPISVLGAVMTAASLGLEPGGPTGECYLVPFERRFKDKGGNWQGIMEANLILGYRGLITLAMRSTYLESMQAEVVRPGDQFSYEYGSRQHLRHRPSEDEDVGGPVTHAYAYARLRGGGETFKVLPWSAIEKIRNSTQGYQADVKYNRERGNRSASPWTNHPEAMARKTAIRRAVNLIPTSSEMLHATTLEDLRGKAYERFVWEASKPGDLPEAMPSDEDGADDFGEEIGEEAVKIEGDSKPAPRRRRRETPAAEASSASAEVAPPTAAPRSPRRRDRARIRGR